MKNLKKPLMRFLAFLAIISCLTTTTFAGWWQPVPPLPPLQPPCLVLEPGKSRIVKRPVLRRVIVNFEDRPEIIDGVVVPAFTLPVEYRDGEKVIKAQVEFPQREYSGPFRLQGRTPLLVYELASQVIALALGQRKLNEFAMGGEHVVYEASTLKGLFIKVQLLDRKASADFNLVNVARRLQWSEGLGRYLDGIPNRAFEVIHSVEKDEDLPSDVQARFKSRGLSISFLRSRLGAEFQRRVKGISLFALLEKVIRQQGFDPELVTEETPIKLPEKISQFLTQIRIHNRQLASAMQRVNYPTSRGLCISSQDTLAKIILDYVYDQSTRILSMICYENVYIDLGGGLKNVFVENNGKDLQLSIIDP